jgi:hypothetical protein
MIKRTNIQVIIEDSSQTAVDPIPSVNPYILIFYQIMDQYSQFHR